MILYIRNIFSGSLMAVLLLFSVSTMGQTDCQKGSSNSLKGSRCTQTPRQRRTTITEDKTILCTEEPRNYQRTESGGVCHILDNETNSALDKASQTALFEEGKTTLLENSTPVLDTVVLQLKKSTDYSIVIKGHADEEGSSIFNDELAVQRAEAIHDYLVSNGISEKRLFVYSPKKEQQVAVAPTRIGRVEFAVLK